MDNLLNATLSTIRKHNMIDTGQTVCVALSGGPDSIALLFLLHRLSGSAGFRVRACHFDHALRPESGLDAEFSRATAQKLGIEFVMERDGSPSERSVQNQARIKRYGFFKKLLDTGYADLVATGHTMDDSVETSIMWMLRGAGPAAFGGVPYMREKYIRPLLDIRKKSILNWLEGAQIEFRLDRTNETDSYLRNRIRRHIIPAMEIQAPGAVEAVARLARLSRDQSELLEDIARERLTRIVVNRFDDRIVIDPASLKLEREAMRQTIYRVALRSAGIDPSCVSLKHFDAIDRMVALSSLGKSLDLPGRLMARLDHEGLTLGRRRERDQFDETAVTWPLELPVGGCVLKVRSAGARTAKGHIADARKIPGDAVFRRRNPGDFLRLKGLVGRKKLKTFLIDRKAPSGMRDIMPLLASGSEILWVPRLFLAPSVCAGDETSECLELSWD